MTYDNARYLFKRMMIFVIVFLVLSMITLVLGLFVSPLIKPFGLAWLAGVLICGAIAGYAQREIDRQWVEQIIGQIRNRTIF